MTVLADLDTDADDTGARTAVTRTDDATPATRRRGHGFTGDRATRSRSAQRAIDRRRKRIEKEEGLTRGSLSAPGRPASLRDRLTRVPFVVPVIALLVIGLGTSLWLSTKAAQDSYRLGVERQQNQALVDKRDSLKRTYESGDSAPELSDKATKLGMIPASNPPRMVVDANGRTHLSADPQPAQGRGMRTINPPIGPDPVSTIDPKKVDDSEGLPGDAVSSSTPQPNSAPSAAASTTTPAATAPAAAAPAPAAVPAPSVVAPAPNVLPQTSPVPNAPGANSGQSR